VSTNPRDPQLPAQLRVVGATDLERRMLNAAARELPSVELTRRMEQALGIGLAASAAAAAATAAAKTAAAGTGAAVAGASTATWPALSIGLVALAVTGAVVGVEWSNGHRASAPASGRTVAAATVPAPAAPELPALDGPPLVAATSVEHPASAHAQHRSARGPAAPSDLRGQIALLDAARASVASRADARALALLDRYDASYPAGAFRPEASALRIEALGSLGRTAQARTLAQRFLAAHADSPLADRVARVSGLPPRDRP
jgi:hypothetical protein